MVSKPNEPVGPAMATVLTYFRKELQPVIADLQLLAENVAAFQVGFTESIRRNKLHKLENEYAQSMARFMAAYKKWHFPDQMFKGIGASYQLKGSEPNGTYLTPTP